jgi:hypothetical protein
VAPGAGHAADVGQALEVVLGEQRAEVVERVRRVADREDAHRCD